MHIPRQTQAIIQNFSHKLWVVVLFGLLLRMLAAYVDYGFFAIDDIRVIILQAYNYAHIPDYSYGYLVRSPLIPIILSSCIKLANLAGLEGPISVVRFVYFCLGIYSLILIPLAFHTVYLISGKKRHAIIAAWLAACYWLIPYISTKALIESIGIPTIAAAFYLLARGMHTAKTSSAHKALYYSGSAIFFSLSAMIRFQNGLFYIAILIFLFIHKRKLFAITGFIAGGLVGFLLQGLMDLSLRGSFMITLEHYIKHNFAHSSNYGTMPWYNYLPMLLGLTLPPASIYIIPAIWRGMKRFLPLLYSLSLFVVTHSIIGHKEERFMFPLLCILVLALPLGHAYYQDHRPSFLSATWQKRLYLSFWVINSILLIPATYHSAQKNVILPMQYLRKQNDVTGLVGYDLVLPKYYGPKGIKYYPIKGGYTKHRSLETLMPAVMKSSKPNYFLFLQSSSDKHIKLLEGFSLRCEPQQAFEADWIDSFLAFVNPYGNRRRGPTILYRCNYPEE